MKMKEIFNKMNKAGFGMKGIIIAVVVAVVMLAVFFMLRVEKEETIKIGAVLSISGPASYVGEEVRDGTTLKSVGDAVVATDTKGEV